MENEPFTDTRRVFRQLKQSDQIEGLYQMLMDLKKQRADDKRQLVDMSGIVSRLEGEVDGIGRRKGGENMTTADKINVEINKRGAGWVWYRDRILAPSVAAAQTIIFLYILYSAFGGKP